MDERYDEIFSKVMMFWLKYNVGLNRENGVCIWGLVNHTDKKYLLFGGIGGFIGQIQKMFGAKSSLRHTHWFKDVLNDMVQDKVEFVVFDDVSAKRIMKVELSLADWEQRSALTNWVVDNTSGQMYYYPNHHVRTTKGYYTELLMEQGYRDYKPTRPPKLDGDGNVKRSDLSLRQRLVDYNDGGKITPPKPVILLEYVKKNKVIDYAGVFENYDEVQQFVLQSFPERRIHRIVYAQNSLTKKIIG